jgi:hypothetical protein
MNRQYLRIIEIPTDTFKDFETLETKLGLFEGDDKDDRDMNNDRDYWKKEKGATSVRYFRLEEYTPQKLLF